MFKTLKFFLNRENRLFYSVKEFGHHNSDLLIIICDPKTDRIFVSHKNRFVNGRIKSASGKNLHVVKEVLKHSRFKESINDFIVAIAETLNVRLMTGNQLYQFIDGALFNIAKSLSKNQSKDERPIINKKEPVVSPYDGQ